MEQLFGLEAINHYHGWGISLLGASIVFAGLVVLSLAISQLHKLLTLWDQRAGWFKNGEKQADAEEQAYTCSHPAYCPDDIHAAAEFYKPLCYQLGESFKLMDLYRLSQENQFPHPYLTVKRLIEANIIVAKGDGYFSLNT